RTTSPTAALNEEGVISGVRDAYERIAAAHAAKWGGETQKEVIEHREKFVNFLPPEGLVIDAGTGSGRDAAWFAEHGRQVLGIDFSEAQLKEARQRHPELPLAIMDVRHLELETNSVAGVWDNATFHHLPPESAKTALSEYLRVLQPGGILFIRTKRFD